MPETAEIRVWINGADTPQEARDWLRRRFEEQNPGSTLTIEEQQWEGLVERLDHVAVQRVRDPGRRRGRQHAGGDVHDGRRVRRPHRRARGLGGDDLLPGFVDGGTVDGKTYAVPYYAGSKFVFYRKDLFEKAGLEVPTTMDEFVDAAVTLKQANPEAGELLRLLAPGPGLAQRRRVRLGRRR